MSSPPARAAALGYTLAEIVVVVLALGVLASIGFSFGRRTLETNRALLAATRLQLVAAANREHFVDRKHYVLHAPGVQSASSRADCVGRACGACDQYGICPPCNLWACGYLAGDDDPYWTLNSCDPLFPRAMAPCGITSHPATDIIACARWKPEMQDRVSAEASQWRYAVNRAGALVPIGGAPTP